MDTQLETIRENAERDGDIETKAQDIYECDATMAEAFWETPYVGWLEATEDTRAKYRAKAKLELDLERVVDRIRERRMDEHIMDRDEAVTAILAVIPH